MSHSNNTSRYTVGLALAALLFGLRVDAEAAVLPDLDLELLVCQAAREHKLTQLRRRAFEYRMEDVAVKLDRKGRVKSTESKTRYVHRSQPNGVPVNETVAVEGKKLVGSALEEARSYVTNRLARLRVDEKELAKSIEREEKKIRDKGEQIDFERGSLSLRLEGVDDIDGAPCWVVSFRPSPGYRGSKKGFLHKATGVFWIDIERPAFRRLELDFFKKTSVALGPLATLSPGSHLRSGLVEHESGVFLVDYVDLELKLKIMFVANKRERRVTRYLDHVQVLPLWPEFVP